MGNIVKRPIAKIIAMSQESENPDVPSLALAETSRTVRRSARLHKDQVMMFNLVIQPDFMEYDESWLTELELSDFDDVNVLDMEEYMDYPIQQREMIMPTVLLRLVDSAQKEVWVKALWDTGSSHSVITKKLRIKLDIESKCCQKKTEAIKSFAQVLLTEEIKLKYKTHSEETLYTGSVNVTLILCTSQRYHYSKLRLYCR